MAQDDASLRTTKKGMAVIVTVLVQSLEQRMPGFEAAFLARLGHAYAEIRDDDDSLDALELLRWTQALLTGFDLVHGQGDPFLIGR